MSPAKGVTSCWVRVPLNGTTERVLAQQLPNVTAGGERHVSRPQLYAVHLPAAPLQLPANRFSWVVHQKSLM